MGTSSEVAVRPSIGLFVQFPTSKTARFRNMVTRTLIGNHMMEVESNVPYGHQKWPKILEAKEVTYSIPVCIPKTT